jgi:hypothetical protein
MGWFQRIVGGSNPPPAPGGPIVSTLVPGKLTARVFAHDLMVGADPMPCWTYVTQGFFPVGQKEFVFTLPRSRGDDPNRPPADPLQFFAQIFSLTEQKQFVFQPRGAGFLGLRGMVGFAYAPPELLPGIEMPPPEQCLTAILLLPGEAEMVQAGWGYRVLSRLGRATRYYPHPPWSDTRRAVVLTRDELNVSMLGKIPVTYLPGAHATNCRRCANCSRNSHRGRKARLHSRSPPTRTRTCASRGSRATPRRAPLPRPRATRAA